MKKIGYILLFAILVIGIYSCSKDDPAPVAPATTIATTQATTGTIGGIISLPVGAGGDITNTRVSIYQSYDDWNFDRVLTAVATNSSGAYTFSNVTPATYYLDAWKDNNNNQAFDTGDFWGVYGSGTYPNFQPSPFSVAAGQTTNITAIIYVVP